jgi:hypothetical protein
MTQNMTSIQYGRDILAIAQIILRAHIQVNAMPRKKNRCDLPLDISDKTLIFPWMVAAFTSY